MRIQHNISALNAHRQLGTNNNAVAKNLEKLSSGYAINRAADNAAGLAISEKMRGQIRGLDQAQANAQDGISLIQTAEGALNETHDILQRMRELSVQSANGTYQNDVDRENIQKEVDALRGEINRIATSTHYNKINLLDGSLSSKGSAQAQVKNIKVDLPTNALSALSEKDAVAGEYKNAVALAGATSTVGDKLHFGVNYQDANGVSQTASFDFTYKVDDKGNGFLETEDGTKYSVAANAAGATATDFQSAVAGELNKSPLADNFKISNAAGVYTFTAKEAGASGVLKITGFTESKTTGGATTDVAAQGLTEATAAKDAYQAVDTTKLTSFDGTNAEKAIFQINGQKFAIVDDDLTPEELQILGDDVHIATGADADGKASALAGLLSSKLGISAKIDGATTTQINLTALPSGTGGSNGSGLTFQIGANGSADQRVPFC